MGSKLKSAKDPMGAHIRLYWEILDSSAWNALSWAQRGLYVAMRRKLVSTNNGNIDATLSTLRHSGITSAATLFSGLRALEAVGLIQRTRHGHLSQGRKVCNLFRFTDLQASAHPKLRVEATPATHNWREFRTIAHAAAAIKQAHAMAKTGRPRAHSVTRKRQAASNTEANRAAS